MRTNDAGSGPAISIQGLVKSFGAVRALDGVDLEAAQGTVLGVLGPNGAGKTTAVRILATLLEPDAGSARVVGLDVVQGRAGAAREDRPGRAVRRGRRPPDRPGEPRHGRPAVRDEARRRARAAGRSSSSASTSPTPPGARPRATRAACAAGSTSPRRSSPGRRCSSSTSRRPASTRAAASGCGRRSRSSSPRARPSCSPRSTSTRPSGSPTASRSSTAARSSPTAPPTS